MKPEAVYSGLIPFHRNGDNRGHEPSIVSHAANGEDVVLQRAFSDRLAGSYIDIGACHPVEKSTTHHFYARDWRGVNVEPDRELLAAFEHARGRDTNVAAAVGRSRGRVLFYPTGERGAGTLSAEAAADRAEGRAPEHVPMITLDDVFDCYAPADEPVDFLRIDVGGGETDVIHSCDWRTHRPRVILVAALDKLGSPAHRAWEPTLLACGYAFALFDGVNRWYCREEEAALRALLASPANARDHWVRVEEHRANTAAARARSEAAAAERRSNERAAESRRALAVREDTIAKLEQRVAGLNAQIDMDRAELAELRTDKSRAELLAADVERARSQAAAALRREAVAEARMAAFAAEFTRRDVDSREHDERAARQTRELQQLAAQLHDVRERLSAAEAELAAVLRSTSWRCMKPFRVGGQVLRQSPALRRLVRKLRALRGANR